jgi:hypothetical protein
LPPDLERGATSSTRGHSIAASARTFTKREGGCRGDWMTHSSLKPCVCLLAPDALAPAPTQSHMHGGDYS